MGAILPSSRSKYGAILVIIVSIIIFTQFGSQHTAIPFRKHDKLFDDIKNSTLGFQKIYAINLPNRSDHRDSLSLAAAFSDLKVTYVDGVTHVDDKALPPGEGGTMKMTEKGNWRAHMNVLRQ